MILFYLKLISLFFFKLQIVFYLCNLHLNVNCLGILFTKNKSVCVVEYHKTNRHFNSSWWTPLLWQCRVNPALVGRYYILEATHFTPCLYFLNNN